MPLTPFVLSQRARVRAFTLIELLTVIAIIGILAAIIIPTVGKVRDTAKSSVCASNLRQLAAACLLYANENKNLLVPMRDNSTGSPKYWRVLIEPYIGSRKGGKNITICPADSITEYPVVYSNGEWPASYGLNFGGGQFVGTNTLYQYNDGTRSKNISVIRQPSRMIMITDIGRNNGGGDQANPSAWTEDRTDQSPSWGYARMPWDGTFNLEWSVWPRHGNKRKANAAFFDGSVRALDLITDLKNHPTGDPLCLFDNH